MHTPHQQASGSCETSLYRCVNYATAGRFMVHVHDVNLLSGNIVTWMTRALLGNGSGNTCDTRAYSKATLCQNFKGISKELSEI
jgi:hypothetical protein